ncbi:MAG: TetR/AcrR family transcriptional regulator [Duganella sp.]
MKSRQVTHAVEPKEIQAAIVPQRDGGGRPRDATRDEAILDAAIAILAEIGYERMTMDMVAVRAKAGKATVYRRWPSKGEMVVEAVGRLKRSLVDLEQLADTGTLRGDLLALFRPQSVEQAEQKMRAMAGMAAMLAQHPKLAEAGHDAIVAPWVAANRTLIERARTRGEVHANAHVDTVAQIIPSLAAYRALIQRRPFDHAFLVEIIDGVLLPALGMTPPQPAA